jgi:hypothetical protein
VSDERDPAVDPAADEGLPQAPSPDSPQGIKDPDDPGAVASDDRDRADEVDGDTSADAAIELEDLP